jgi:hemoglobin-like flavoprotein
MLIDCSASRTAGSAPVWCRFLFINHGLFEKNLNLLTMGDFKVFPLPVDILLMEQSNLNLFRDSLARVTARDGFFDSFYDHFIRQSDEIAAIFHHQDMAQLKEKLRTTLEMVALTVDREPGITLYMEMLGRIHRRLNIERRHFDMWQMALLDTVAVYDEAYSERVGAAWSQVIGHVIDLIYKEQSSPAKLAS